jgi:large subunit ribosomal protein L30
MSSSDAAEMKKIRIQLYASPTGCPDKHRKIVNALGLKKLNRIVERPDTPEFHGMVKKVPHLLRVVE